MKLQGELGGEEAAFHRIKPTYMQKAAIKEAKDRDVSKIYLKQDERRVLDL